MAVRCICWDGCGSSRGGWRMRSGCSAAVCAGIRASAGTPSPWPNCWSSGRTGRRPAGRWRRPPPSCRGNPGSRAAAIGSRASPPSAVSGCGRGWGRPRTATGAGSWSRPCRWSRGPPPIRRPIRCPAGWCSPPPMRCCALVRLPGSPPSWSAAPLPGSRRPMASIPMRICFRRRGNAIRPGSSRAGSRRPSGACPGWRD